MVRSNQDNKRKQETSDEPQLVAKRTRRSQPPTKKVASMFVKRPKVMSKQATDLLAESLGHLLGRQPQYLTSEGRHVSWILHVPKWFPSKAPATYNAGTNGHYDNTTVNKPVQDFVQEWKLHPTERKQLKIFGRPVEEKRWSQAWGKPLSYSGMIDHNDRPIADSPNLPWLMDQVNSIMKKATGNTGLQDDETKTPPRDNQVNSGRLFHEYNACLQNWYQPEDSIGLHSDDETYLYANYPIFSISWGGPRRFLLRPKVPKQEAVEVWLQDGDLLIMGGACQTTHKHEVPKPRKKDPVTSNRISWTIRAIKP